MSSRANAETWGYPRRREFEKHLQLAATEWFERHGRATSRRHPYLLAEWEQWPENIILPEVAEYVQSEAAKRHANRQGFPLHRYLHHGLSSQAMLFNLVGPLIIRKDLVPLREALSQQGIVCPEGPLTATLEHEDREVFREDTGQPTSLDLVLEGESGAGTLFVEAKLVEAEFGGCSVFADGDCDGRNPAPDLRLCYLHHLGRKYWSLLQEHGFLSGSIGSDATCTLASHYQFFREVLFALHKGGAFVLLYDARNPTFYREGAHGPRGLMPFLLTLVPESQRAGIASVSIQQVVDAIKSSGRHEWTEEFERKYALNS